MAAEKLRLELMIDGLPAIIAFRDLFLEVLEELPKKRREDYIDRFKSLIDEIE